MTPEAIKQALTNMRDFFERSTRPLQEQHSGFSPQEGLFTVAGQVAHAAQTVEWFFDGAFGKEWDMDFEGLERKVRAVTSLTEAREWFDRAVKRAIEITESRSAEEWSSLFDPNPIMGEVPRYAIMSGLTDHTAHHRGALTVYQRLLGLTPLMPYMET